MRLSSATSAFITRSDVLSPLTTLLTYEAAIPARMYALAEAALADARIAYWESKYFYNFWRPITAIRVGDQDGNPATEVDPACSHSATHLISRVPLWTRLHPWRDFSCAATSLRQRCAEFSNDHDEPERRAEDPHLHTFIPGRERGHQRACVRRYPLSQLGPHRPSSGSPCRELGL